MPSPHDVLFRTLADPTRRAIFERLCREGEQTVGALTARAGVSQPAVSKHLRVLREAGLVVTRAQAQRRLYRLNPAPLAEVDAWLSRCWNFWEARLESLKAYSGEGRSLDPGTGALSRKGGP